MSLVINPLITLSNVSIITLCTVMKVPQIYSVMKTKSAVGISMQSLLLEFSAYSIMMSYNIYSSYPLASYFEYILLFVQDLVLLYIIIDLLNIESSSIILPAIVFSGLILSMSLGLLPAAIISVLFSLCTALSTSSKVVQLHAIWAKKDSTGVSVATWAISAYTSFARIFTVYVESFDLPLLINFFVSFVIAALIVVAAIVYAPKRDTTEKKKKQ